jgi:membrane carboxypeptidase/penicillin-binding protein
VEEGSGTITMQLARNVSGIGHDRTLASSSRCAWPSRSDRLPEGRDPRDPHPNRIYFGNGARGIEAAARHYFGVRARELSLAQAALLAALSKAPTHYDPRRNPDEARSRRDLVLSLMAEQNRITSDAAEHARRAPLGVTRRRVAGERPVFAGYFIEEVRRQLEELMGGDLYDRRLHPHDARRRRAAGRGGGAEGGSCARSRAAPWAASARGRASRGPWC